MSDIAYSVFGVGVVIPITIFNQVFPGYFTPEGHGGGWIRTDKEMSSQVFGSLQVYFSEFEEEGTETLFLTTNKSYSAELFKPATKIDINRVIDGAPQLQQWVTQTFPSVAPNFGLTLYAYSKFE